MVERVVDRDERLIVLAGFRGEFVEGELHLFDRPSFRHPLKAGGKDHFRIRLQPPKIIHRSNQAIPQPLGGIREELQAPAASVRFL